jgi:hypothetical protein
MKYYCLIITVCLFALCSATCEASWILYHKPEFKGRVVDIETKAPIEGAVVVAIYEKHTLNPPAGSYTNIIGVKEVFTDKNGRFSFPTYTTIIHPLSYSGNCSFLIYKPGYGNLGQIGIEHYLSGKAEKDWERVSNWNKNLILRFLTDGTVEIPKLTSKEEMEKAWMKAHIWGASLDEGEIPVLFKTVTNENNKYMRHP